MKDQCEKCGTEFEARRYSPSKRKRFCSAQCANGKLTASQKDEATRLYESGIGTWDLAKRYGIAPVSMWDVIRRRTTMRSENEATKNPFNQETRADALIQRIVARAIRRGVIKRPDKCSECGRSDYGKKRTKIHGHHDDYNNPLGLRWLCQGCHLKWHRSHAPLPAEDMALAIEAAKTIVKMSIAGMKKQKQKEAAAVSCDGHALISENSEEKRT